MNDALVHAHHSGNTIRLVSRSGEMEVDWPDVFYLTEADAARLPNSWKGQIGESRGGFVRVQWAERSRSSRAARLKYFKESVFDPRGIDPLEADVHPVQRFLVENPTVQLAQDWRLLWFDLETEKIADWDKPWESRILSFSWRSSDGRKGHVRAADRTDAAESALLSTFVRLANRHDVLLAWNGDRFDFPVVKSRAAILGVEFDPALYHWLDHLVLFRRYYSRSEDGSVTSSFSLNAIARAFLGDEKVPVEVRAKELGFDGKSDLFTWIWQAAPDLLREYNDQDVDLMRRLEEKTGFIGMHVAMCRLCRVLPGSQSLYPMTLVDGRMLIRGHEAGYHFPSRFRDDEAPAFHRAKGAFVPEADVGLHESVAVLDYARMYPSIIRTFNMSLDTLSPDGDLKVPDTDERGRSNGGTIARFKSAPEGHLPAALRGVLELRKVYSTKQSAAEVGSPEFYDFGRLSTSCKILANTFYGVILSPYSRFFRQEIGESVTSIGRYLLARTIQTAEESGHRLVFGDTDSVAIVATDEQATALKEKLNRDVIPPLLERFGVEPDRNEVATDYEKRFRRIVVTASKRYAGVFAVYKGKAAPKDAPVDVRGLEIVRSDVAKAARSLQRKVLDLILLPERAPTAESLRAFVLSERTKFWEDGAPVDQLVLTKGMTKPIADYATKPVQVKVAEKMVEAGREVWAGSKIPFVLVEGAKEAVHPDDVGDREVDRLAYWNLHLYPPTERVLEAAYPGAGWESLRLNSRTAIRGQAEFTFDAPSRPARPIRRVQATRPVRRVARPEPVVLVLREERVDALRLKKALEAFPGSRPLKVVVEVRDGERMDVELDVPMSVDSSHPSFAQALRAIGARVI